MKLNVYTDGACSGNPGPGGYGILINTDIDCIMLSGGELDTTNNRMELKAITECLKYILDNIPETDEVNLFSDSAYCINAVNNKWIDKWKRTNWKTSKGDNVKNKDLWINLINLLEQFDESQIKLNFNKVKGHAGNVFNEKVDELAKKEVQNLI